MFSGHIFSDRGLSLCWPKSVWDDDTDNWFQPGIRHSQSVGLTEQDELCKFCADKVASRMKAKRLKPT
jgi:hypothetical protein